MRKAKQHYPHFTDVKREIVRCDETTPQKCALGVVTWWYLSFLRGLKVSLNKCLSRSYRMNLSWYYFQLAEKTAVSGPEAVFRSLYLDPGPSLAPQLLVPLCLLTPGLVLFSCCLPSAQGPLTMYIQVLLVLWNFFTPSFFLINIALFCACDPVPQGTLLLDKKSLSKVLVSANELIHYPPREHNLHFNWGFLENCASSCSSHPLDKTFKGSPLSIKLISNATTMRYKAPHNLIST